MSSTLHDSDDDTPQLSAHALQALQEFYAEHAARNEDDGTTKDMPTEDWVSHTETDSCEQRLHVIHILSAVNITMIKCKLAKHT